MSIIETGSGEHLIALRLGRASKRLDECLEPPRPRLFAALATMEE